MSNINPARQQTACATRSPYPLYPRIRDSKLGNIVAYTVEKKTETRAGETQ